MKDWEQRHFCKNQPTMTTQQEGTLATLAQNVSIEMHHHLAVQSVVSSGNPCSATVDQQDIESSQGFLIHSGIPRACQPPHSAALVISVDATSAKGTLLKQKLSHRKFAL